MTITIKKCAHCGKEFEAKKSNAKFCSDNCRNIAHQKKKRQNNTAVRSSLGIDGQISRSIIEGKLKISDIFNVIKESETGIERLVVSYKLCK